MKNNQAIRVLQCVSNMDRAGIETALMNYYRQIDKKRVQFDFLVNKKNEGDYSNEIKAMGGRIYTTPGLSPFKWRKYQTYLKNLFNSHPEYHIIHCQNEEMGYPALLAAKKCGIKNRITHAHSSKIELDYKAPIKYFYKKKLEKTASHLVACGEKASMFMFGKKEKIIPNAILTDNFVFNSKIRNKIRKEYKLTNEFVIGHVGRFEKPKNHKLLLEIFYEITKRENQARLLLVGDGTLKKKIIKKANKLGLMDKIIFAGNVKNANEYYQAFDVFVMPSKNEGLPVVGIEAQASGLKCIFSDNITKEVCVTNNVKFVKINDMDGWVSSILASKKYQRKNQKSDIVQSGFDIAEATKNIQLFYERMGQNE